MAVDETSQPIELLLSVDRDGPATLGAQIEDQLRQAIRDGVVRGGTRVPSTRDLARQLSVSRRVVVDAYGQLSAEGYLTLRQGARPVVAETTASAGAPAAPLKPPPPPRFNFKPSIPDVSTFPRTAWLRCLREALSAMADDDLEYGDACGVDLLRTALADYLGRARGVVADPARVVVTAGYSQGLGIVCRALARRGARTLAVEDPSNPEQRWIAERAGLDSVLVPVDDDGIRVDALAASKADAVALTPAHQHPTGVVLSGERRSELLTWLRETNALAIEDDYDAEYRYDRAAVGALQGLEPDHVVYAGSASKTLAPALRLGWLVVPDGWLASVREEKLLADMGTTRIDQYALALFLRRGELDRHLRRMRLRYRERRDSLIAALAAELPEATVRGVAAGLHVTAELPPSYDEQSIRAEAAKRRVVFNTMGDYEPATRHPPTLMLGYARLPEAGVAAGVRELAAAVRRSAAASTP